MSLLTYHCEKCKAEHYYEEKPKGAVCEICEGKLVHGFPSVLVENQNRQMEDLQDWFRVYVQETDDKDLLNNSLSK